MKSLAPSKLSRIVIVLAAALGCGGGSGHSLGTGGSGGSTGTGGGGASGAGGSSSGGAGAGSGTGGQGATGGARGGVGGATAAGGGAGGAAGDGGGGAGNRGGTGGRGGIAGGAQGGVGGAAGSGRCTTVQFQPSHASQDQILVDMNGDGRLDVVSGWVDTTALHVMVYLQTSPRVFAAPDQYDYTTHGAYVPTRIAAADLDQDGVPDLAMPDGYGDVALMLSGGGSGYSFAPWLGPPAGTTIAALTDVSLADFDGDGYRDIAVAVNSTNISLGIYWGLGKGAFAARADQNICKQGSSTVVADVNEDGLPDLAISCLQSGGQVLVNQGGRSFKQVLLPGGSQSIGIAAGDLNHDGHVDFVLGDKVLKQLIVSLGDGHGNFTVPTGSVATTGSLPGTAAIGDLDGDGNADVVLNDYNQPAPIFFYHGTGDGHFQASQPFPIPGPTGEFPIGDVDGDGFQDLLIANGPTIIYGPCP